MRIDRTLFTLVVFGGILISPLDAQDVAGPSGSPTMRLHGTIIDLSTDRPLPGAFVAPQGLLTGFLSDSAGRFVLDVPTARVYYLYVERLGYHTTRLEVRESDATRPLQIKIRPDPVLLEGVEVLVDRYERRRRFHAGTVRVYGQEQLMRSGSLNALSFIRSSGGVRIQVCPRDPLSWCVRRRGRLSRVQVCLDEMPLFDGGRSLESFIPQDFYLIEIYDQGMQVRVYTEHFVAAAARRGSPVRPLIMGC
jgi:hypothetical protein